MSWILSRVHGSCDLVHRREGRLEGSVSMCWSAWVRVGQGLLCHSFWAVQLKTRLNARGGRIKGWHSPLLLGDACACSGPLDQALPFFESLGFMCPRRKDPGAFLQARHWEAGRS